MSCFFPVSFHTNSDREHIIASLSKNVKDINHFLKKLFFLSKYICIGPIDVKSEDVENTQTKYFEKHKLDSEN